MAAAAGAAAARARARARAGRARAGPGPAAGAPGAAAAPADSGGSGGSSSSGPATAAQLASDQANLDSANAALSEAKQNLAAAVLAAPISGTIAQVNVTSGQQVTGSEGTSTSSDFVIEGAGGEEATTTVSVSEVGEIKVGQPATITLDGSATPINGRVDSIGMLSSTSSSGSASYPVTIGLAAGTPTLFAGSDAQVSITLANVSDAVTVPTSAVEGIGAASFVTVLQGGKPETVRVTVGATGPVRHPDHLGPHRRRASGAGRPEHAAADEHEPVRLAQPHRCWRRRIRRGADRGRGSGRPRGRRLTPGPLLALALFGCGPGPGRGTAR